MGNSLYKITRNKVIVASVQLLQLLLRWLMFGVYSIIYNHLYLQVTLSCYLQVTILQHIFAPQFQPQTLQTRTVLVSFIMWWTFEIRPESLVCFELKQIIDNRLSGGHSQPESFLNLINQVIQPAVVADWSYSSQQCSNTVGQVGPRFESCLGHLYGTAYIQIESHIFILN